MRRAHAMPFGATLQAGGGAVFRLWAPAAKAAEVLLETGARSGPSAAAAARSADGWFTLRHATATAGDRYRWRIDGDLVVPDPAARFNPDGPHGASELVDPLAFEWDDDGWAGRPWHEAVFYELHVGTFTPEGSYDAAAARLPALAALGITAVQLMPLADFPGRFGWGYDGVLPFAPFHGYGRPEALKRFVQAAHGLGLMVFADVVYNHFGPDGNYLHAYAPDFFSTRHRTAWGAGLNYDGAGSEVVRAFVVANALYWLQEFRVDGLRLDAVHAMRDDSRPDILEELSRQVRAACAGRQVHLVLENDSNDLRRLAATPTPGRYDGQWSGDVHHPLHVLLTGERDGYYAEYDQPLAQLGRALAKGFARQGGPHNAEGAEPRRDAEGEAPLGAIVNFLQTHDQIGNRAFGERLLALADPDAVRLAAAIVLLAPSPPLLFMGEEDGSTTPFQYFADWDGALRDAVREGRRQEFSGFPRYAEAARSGHLPDPCSRETFERCKLDPAATGSAPGSDWRDFHARLLALRAQHVVPRLPALAPTGHEARHDGTVLCVRWHVAGARPGTLLLRANLSPQPAAPGPAIGGADGGGDGTLLFSLGTVAGGRFGPWSGEWRWIPAGTRTNG